jgi:hypothetical protein
MSSPSPYGEDKSKGEGEEEEEGPSIRKQLNDIWMTVQLKSVWKPMVRNCSDIYFTCVVEI